MLVYMYLTLPFAMPPKVPSNLSTVPYTKIAWYDSLLTRNGASFSGINKLSLSSWYFVQDKRNEEPTSGTRCECKLIGPTLLKSPYRCGVGFTVYLAVGGLVLCASMGMLLMVIAIWIKGWDMEREKENYCRSSCLSSIQYKNLNPYWISKMTYITLIWILNVN